MRIEFFDSEHSHICTVEMDLPNVGERVFLYPENPSTPLESVRPVAYKVTKRDFIARPGKESYVEVHLTKEKKPEQEDITLSCEELAYLKRLEKASSNGLNDWQAGWTENEAIRTKLANLKLASVTHYPASNRAGDCDSTWCKITAKGSALINKK